MLSWTTTAEVFNVFPLRGEVEPGNNVEVHFNYFSLSHPSGKIGKYSGLAVYHIIGGPYHRFPLSGLSASISYPLRSIEIDLDQKIYSKTSKVNVVLASKSKGPNRFSVTIPQRCLFHVLITFPQSGTAGAKAETLIKMSVIAGLTQSYREFLIIEIGGFEERQN
jgi:hydrocephalus-inducing protein